MQQILSRYTYRYRVRKRERFMYIPSNFSSKKTFAEAMARSERRIKDSRLEFGALDAIVFTTQKERESCSYRL